MYHSKRARSKYKERMVIEQVLDQLKEDWGLGRLPWHVRGVRRLKVYVD